MNIFLPDGHCVYCNGGMGSYSVEAPIQSQKQSNLSPLKCLTVSRGKDNTALFNAFSSILMKIMQKTFAFMEKDMNGVIALKKYYCETHSAFFAAEEIRKK